MESKNIVIDIREEHEILENKLEPNDNTTIIFNIPMRHVGFNKDLIKQLSKTNKILFSEKIILNQKYIFINRMFIMRIPKEGMF